MSLETYKPKTTISSMQKNHIIRIRVSKPQLDKIKNETERKGYRNTSHYLRDLGLNNQQFLEEKVIDTNRKVIEILKILQK